MITSHKLFVVQEPQGKGIRYFFEDATGKADGGKVDMKFPDFQEEVGI